LSRNEDSVASSSSFSPLFGKIKRRAEPLEPWGGRVAVEDVLVDPIFAESELQGIMARAHVRAVQSTPLIGRNKAFLGVISTHFRAAHPWRAHELALVDLYARDVSDFIASNAIGANSRGRFVATVNG
jgi:GAF domain-containing protein